MEQPRAVSSLKNISKLLSSSEARISDQIGSHNSFILSPKFENKKEDKRARLTEFVVFVRRKLGSAKLAEHLSRELKRVFEIVGVLRTKKKRIRRVRVFRFEN